MGACGVHVHLLQAPRLALARAGAAGPAGSTGAGAALDRLRDPGGSGSASLHLFRGHEACTVTAPARGEERRGMARVGTPGSSGVRPAPREAALLVRDASFRGGCH